MSRWATAALVWSLTAIAVSAAANSPAVASDSPTAGVAAEPTGVDSQRRVNAALHTLLRAIDADELFAVVDLEHRELRLHHGRALLRTCPIESLTVPVETAALQSLTQRPRRYTRSDPYAQRGPGALDWEHYLVAAATEDCALYFSGGLLIYASQAWASPRPPQVRLTTNDLRAVYDALAPDTDLVLLPPGWDDAGAESPP